MAGILFQGATGSVSMTAGTPKTVLSIRSASNQRVLIKEISISGQAAASGTDAPYLIEFLKGTGTTGTGTSLTLAKCDPNAQETLNTTAVSNFTSEPTATTLGYSFTIQPQSGEFKYIVPITSPWIVSAGAASTVGNFNIRVTSPATASSPVVYVSFRAEE